MARQAADDGAGEEGAAFMAEVAAVEEGQAEEGRVMRMKLKEEGGDIGEGGFDR